MLTELLTGPSANGRDRGVRGRHKKAAGLLLRHTTVDLRLRGEKGLERLRAWCRSVGARRATGDSSVVYDARLRHLIEELRLEVANKRPHLSKVIPKRRERDEAAEIHQRGR
jgi:hypothetical protein